MASLHEENAALAAAHEALKADYASLRQQLDWFRRQLFGRHSEKRLDLDASEQASLFESLGMAEAVTEDAPTEQITYRRCKVRDDAVNERGLRFDESVPVTTIHVRDPAVQSIPQAVREVIGEKVTHRLSQPAGELPGVTVCAHGGEATGRS